MEYSLSIGRMMGLDEAMLEHLRLAAILHDIGKIGVGDRILLKGGRLDEDELATMNLHPQYGADILVHVEQLKDVIPACGPP